MKQDDKMVKKERSGNVGPIGGQKADEYTEKYESVTEGIAIARDIIRGKQCSSDGEATIRTAQLALNDMSPSHVKKEITNLLNDAAKVCKKQK